MQIYPAEGNPVDHRDVNGWHGQNTKWYCPACGLEYKHAIKDGPEDSIGQDLRFSYVVFMQFEMKHGRHTFCAMAAAPCDFLNNILTTLKLVLAYSKIKFNKGAQVAITDMMTLSNEMFVEAMKGFPKVTLKIKKPVHHAQGDYIKIVGNGVESLQEKDIGQDLSFLDMNTALKNGFFGKKPKIWGDPEWKLLIDYVTQGLDFSNEEWDKMAWTPQIWSTLSEPKTKVPPSGKAPHCVPQGEGQRCGQVHQLHDGHALVPLARRSLHDHGIDADGQRR